MEWPSFIRFSLSSVRSRPSPFPRHPAARWRRWLLLLVVFLVPLGAVTRISAHSPAHSPSHTPTVVGEPMQLLRTDSAYFLKVDLTHPFVRPVVLLPHNGAGGLQPLGDIAKQLDGQGYTAWAVINGDLFSPQCPYGEVCSQGLTYVGGEYRAAWAAYDEYRQARGNIGFDQWNGVEINVGDNQSKRHMVIGGGPRVVIGGGEPTCTGELHGAKTFFPASGEWFDDDARWWCTDTRSISLIGHSADGRYLFVGMSLGGNTVTQIARWLREQGAAEVLRLDSGGSSKMYHDGMYIGGQGSQPHRPIANAFAIVVDPAPAPPPAEETEANIAHDPPSTTITPRLREPMDGHTITGERVWFAWEGDAAPSRYVFRVRDVPTIDGMGLTILNEIVYEPNHRVAFGPEWQYSDLYWSVKYDAPDAEWAPMQRFRFSPDAAPVRP